MVLNRSEKGKELRQALWTTHEEINKAVAKIEEILLLCRGKSYLAKDDNGKDKPIDEKEVQKKAISLARNIQKQNGKTNTNSNDEIIKTLKQLHTTVIAAGAQGARTFACPLMLKSSKGGESAKKKIVEPLPTWVEKMQNNVSGWEEESIKWIQSSEGIAVRNNFDNKSGWIKVGKPDYSNTNWQKAFVADQKIQRKNIQESGSSGVLFKLRTLGLLPLFETPIKLSKSKPKKKDEVGPWNQMVLRLTVQQMSGWEECNQRTENEYEELKEERDKQEKFVEERYNKTLIAKIHAYENARKKKTQAKYEYVIKRREIRSWEKVLKEWRKPKCNSEQDRIIALNTLQKKLKGRFGDPDVLRWIAKEGNEDIWRTDGCLTDIVKLNGLNFRLDPNNPNKKKEHAISTLSEPRIHPCWVCYAPTGANLENYILYYDDSQKKSSKLENKEWAQIKKKANGENNGKQSLFIAMSLLCKEGTNLVSVPFRIKLAASDQIKNFMVSRGEKTVVATFIHPREINENYTAKLSESAVLLDRPFMERDKDNEDKYKKNLGKLRDGDFGKKDNTLGIRFKLVCDVESMAPKEWLKNEKICIPDIGLRYSISDTTFKKKAFKQIGDIWPGLRIMSVDMGLRNFASCSIFEIVSKEPSADKTYYEAVEGKLWAVHITSFILNLPGEKKNPIPTELWQELNDVEDLLEFQRAFIKLQGKSTDKERKEYLDFLQNLDFENDESRKHNKKLLTDKIIADLNNAVSSDNWLILCQDYHKEIEKDISGRISAWRNNSSKSMRVKRLTDTLARSTYAINQKVRQNMLQTLISNKEFDFASEELSNLQNAVNLDADAWEKRVNECIDKLYKKHPSYNIGLSLSGLDYLTRVRNLIKSWSAHPRKPDDQRTNDEGFASNLLEHINLKKEDRIKKGADQIIQAARGRKYDENTNKWVPKFEPCRIILFEDLSRYNFKTDRPRKENKKLMQWSHREIINEVERQADLYGITIGTILAEFTSKYCAINGSPGIRAKQLTQEDLDNPFIKEKLEEIKTELKLKELALDMLVPWDLGEIFVTIDKQNNIVKHHADINAARNLQRRFATAYGEPCRMTVIHNVPQNCCLPETIGIRLQNALKSITNRNQFCKFIPYRNKKGEIISCSLHGINKDEFLHLGGKLKDEQTPNNKDNKSRMKKGEKLVIFRDPSRNVIHKDRWYEQSIFWNIVHKRINKALKKKYGDTTP